MRPVCTLSTFDEVAGERDALSIVGILVSNLASAIDFLVSPKIGI